RDASNLFGVKTNNKWKPLWSVGAAWAINEEPFYNWRLFPYLKLRATYGYSGNVNNSVAAVTTIRYNSGLSRVSRFRYAVIDNPPNTELRWEQVGTSNIAIDFASKNNRVTGSVEFYRKKGTDLISYVPIDPTMGFGGMAMNVGSLRSQGIDVRLNSLNTTGVVSWRSNV